MVRVVLFYGVFQISPYQRDLGDNIFRALLQSVVQLIGIGRMRVVEYVASRPEILPFKVLIYELLVNTP